MTKHNSETLKPTQYLCDCGRRYLIEGQVIGKNEDAVPQVNRLAIEQQAAYYFGTVRKFDPLDLDHYSLENWKDFIMWRERNAEVRAVS